MAPCSGRSAGRWPSRPSSVAEPRAGEVRVRILASGVCHSDLHVRDGEWPRPTPVVMGHEGAGVVEAVGPGVAALRVGQPVVLSWLVPCGVCRWCRTGRPWACPDSPSFRHRLPDGATALTAAGGEPVLSYCGIGTMAGSTVVPEAAAIPLPDGVDPAVAALIGCCVSTGVGAVVKTARGPGRFHGRRHRPRRRRPVVRHGCGAGRGRPDRGDRPGGGEARGRPWRRRDGRPPRLRTTRRRRSGRCAT